MSSTGNPLANITLACPRPDRFLHAGAVAVHTSERALHVHGGYGFTTEYDIHLYLRRAKGISLSQGDPRDLWEQVGRSLVREA